MFIALSLLGAAMLCGLLGWAFWHGKTSGAAEQIRLDQVASSIAFEQLVKEFDGRARSEWAFVESIRLERAQRFLMLSADGKQLRYAQLTHSPVSPVSDDWVMPINEIVAVEFTQDSETVMHVETATTVQTDGQARRAALGGILLGTTGAVIGASAGSTTATTASSATSVKEKGTPYLVIATTDLARPLVKLAMPNASTAEHWLHRLRACMLRTAV